jgi:hypothetical protein
MFVFGVIRIGLTVFGTVEGIVGLIKMKDYDDKYMHILSDLPIKTSDFEA